MVRFLSLVSGSSGNSSLITDGNTTLLIDCGISGKKLKERLEEANITPESIDAILVTHEHSDHTKGIGVISRRYNLPVFATEKTLLHTDLGKTDPSLINIIKANETFEIGSIQVHSFPIPHDAADPVGYSFVAEGKKYTLATDIGFMPDSLLCELCGSRQIILESNHDVEMLKIGDYPFYLKERILSKSGHLSNEITAQTAVMLAKAGTENIMLAHLSNENNTPEIAEITTLNALCKNGFSNVELKVASRHCITQFAV